MRVFQPFDDLVSGLGLSGAAYHPAVGLPDLRPEHDILLGRLRRVKPGTPKIREPLESGTFGGGKPSHTVASIDKGGVLEIPCCQGGGLLLDHLGEGAGGHGVGRPLHHGDATLVAGGVAAALVNRSGGARFIDTAVGIVREHPLAKSRTNAVALRYEQRLVVVAGEGGGHILLNERPFAAAFAARANLQRLGSGGLADHELCFTLPAQLSSMA